MIFIIELPDELAEEFSPSLTNPNGKVLKSVDMYDFLDYMIGQGQQNQATSELKDALIGLKKLESSQPNPPSPNNPNNTPPTKANKNTAPSNDVDIIPQSKIHKGKAMPIQQAEKQSKIYELKINTQKMIKPLLKCAKIYTTR